MYWQLRSGRRIQLWALGLFSCALFVPWSLWQYLKMQPALAQAEQKPSETTVGDVEQLETAQISEPLIEETVPFEAVVIEEEDGDEKYFARDFPLHLGWNNIRYIVESTIWQAHLLKRTAVIPSHIYARGCELPHEACDAFAERVNRTEVTNDKDYTKFEQAGWVIPIELLVDLEAVRKRHRVVTADYFIAQDSDENLLHLLRMSSTGSWELDDSEAGAGMVSVITPEVYQPKGARRVDTLPVGTDARVTLYTYATRQDYYFTKDVTEQQIEHEDRLKLKPWTEEFINVKERLLLLKGEVHNHSPPGDMFFTSEKARQAYTDFVLHGLPPVSPVTELAKTVYERIKADLGGEKLWVGVHLRRGDFVEIHRAESDVGRQMGRLRMFLRRAALHLDIKLPKDGLPDFVLATDERDTHSLEIIGGKRISDYVTHDDRRLFWGLIFTDVSGLVEQGVLAMSPFFIGSAMSSLSGGVMNQRMARGEKSATTLLLPWV